MKNDQFLGRLSVCVMKSKESQEWFRNADIPSARKIIRVQTNKTSRRGKGKSGIAKQFKTGMFKECYCLMLKHWVRKKYVRIYTGLLLSKRMSKKTKGDSICFCVCFMTSSVQWDTWPVTGTCSTLCRLPRGDEVHLRYGRGQVHS